MTLGVSGCRHHRAVPAAAHARHRGVGVVVSGMVKSDDDVMFLVLFRTPVSSQCDLGGRGVLSLSLTISITFHTFHGLGVWSNLGHNSGPK